MAKITWESEKELEDFIFKAMQEKNYDPIVDQQIDWSGRQIRIGAYGVADIVTVSYCPDPYEPSISITVYEIKKDQINTRAFGQVSRYMKGVKHYFEISYPDQIINVYGVLVGTCLADDDSSKFLIDACEDISVYLARMSLESGVDFTDSNGWVRTEPDFGDFHQQYGRLFVDACDVANQQFIDFINNQHGQEQKDRAD